MRINQKIRNKLNRTIDKFNGFFYEIPLSDINEALHSRGFMLWDSDGKEPWSGILCGTNETVDFGLATIKKDEVINSMLRLSWYRRPESGRYEIVVYIS